MDADEEESMNAGTCHGSRTDLCPDCSSCEDCCTGEETVLKENPASTFWGRHGTRGRSDEDGAAAYQVSVAGRKTDLYLRELGDWWVLYEKTRFGMSEIGSYRDAQSALEEAERRFSP